MGKSVLAFRIALEAQISRWKAFRKALKGEEERKAFDELMDICRNNAMVSGAACNPIVFEPIVMSIVLAHQCKLTALEWGVHELLWRKICNNEALNVKAEE